jgi:hypothetical protein
MCHQLSNLREKLFLFLFSSLSPLFAQSPTLSDDEWRTVNENLQTCADRQKATSLIVNFRTYVRRLERDGAFARGQRPQLQSAQPQSPPPSPSSSSPSSTKAKKEKKKKEKKSGGTRMAVMTPMMMMMPSLSLAAEHASRGGAGGIWKEEIGGGRGEGGDKSEGKDRSLAASITPGRLLSQAASSLAAGLSGGGEVGREGRGGQEGRGVPALFGAGAVRSPRRGFAPAPAPLIH